MSFRHCILALADDMTGALEIGAKFRAAGIYSLVSAKPIAARSADAVIFDTETRHSSPEAARQEIRRFVLSSGAVRPQLIYKKTDSTLRGNISAEMQALVELFPEFRIGYAPAYPALGRTVKDGVLFVDGIAVSDTAFAYDILNPIHDSRVSSILEPGLPCTIFDGMTDADLVTTATTILSDDRMRIAAGPAGLAAAIAQRISAPRRDPPPLPKVRTCLVMNGSLHERAAAQMRCAEEQGHASFNPGAAWRILRRSYPSGATPAEVAMENGKYVLEQIASDAPDGVLVIGGDTAFAVVTALGLPTLTPISEVVPGSPISRIEAAQIAEILPGRKRDLFLITKAGGFGALDTLCRIREILDTDAT